jgi:hypothetical protein
MTLEIKDASLAPKSGFDHALGPQIEHIVEV